MIGRISSMDDQITVCRRFELVWWSLILVRFLVGPVGGSELIGPKFWPGPNFIGSKFWFELNRSETNWSGTWSVFSVPVRVGPVRSVFLSKIFELISKFSRIFLFVDDNV